MKKLAIGAAFALLAFPAAAQEAEVTIDLNMRAGPATRYPIITTIPAGRGVDVYGCLASYDWCDVGWRGFRGWVFTDYLEYYYRNDYRPVIEWGPRIGLPVITFTFGDYARRHYRNMPWYEDRWRWERRDRRDRRDRDWNDDEDFEFRGRVRDRVEEDYGDDDESQTRRMRRGESQEESDVEVRQQQADDQPARQQRRMMRSDENTGPNRRCNPARENCPAGRSQSQGASPTQTERTDDSEVMEGTGPGGNTGGNTGGGTTD
jgi:uncharacterized protein YraI